jgi:hypothetical protein
MPTYTDITQYLEIAYPKLRSILKGCTLHKLIKRNITLIIPSEKTIKELDGYINKRDFGPATSKLKQYIIKGNRVKAEDFNGKNQNLCLEFIEFVKAEGNDVVHVKDAVLTKDLEYFTASSCGYENTTSIWKIDESGTLKTTKETNAKTGGAIQYEKNTKFQILKRMVRTYYEYDYTKTLCHFISHFKGKYPIMRKICATFFTGHQYTDIYILTHCDALFDPKVLNEILAIQFQDNNEYEVLITNRKCGGGLLLNNTGEINKSVQSIIKTIMKSKGFSQDDVETAFITYYDEFFKNLADKNVIEIDGEVIIDESGNPVQIFDDDVYSKIKDKPNLLSNLYEISFITTRCKLDSNPDRFIDPVHIWTAYSDQIANIKFNDRENTDLLPTIAKYLLRMLWEYPSIHVSNQNDVNNMEPVNLEEDNL